MLLSEREIEVLIKIADSTLAPNANPTLNYKVFRAQNAQYLDELDQLERDNLLYQEREKEICWLPLLTLWELKKHNKCAKNLLDNCHLLVSNLRVCYEEHQDKPIQIDELIAVSRLSEKQIRQCCFFLKRSHIFGGYSTDLIKDPNFFIELNEVVLRNELADIIERDRGWSKRNKHTELDEPIQRNSVNERIFLCYAREDKEAVLEIYHDLKKAGLNPWMDKEDLLPGEEWEKVISKTLHEARFIIIFFSSTSVAKRGYVQKEFRLALDVWDEMPEGEISVIPIRLDQCEVPQRFMGLHYLDYFDVNSFDKLVWTIYHQVNNSFKTNKLEDRAIKLVESIKYHNELRDFLESEEGVVTANKEFDLLTSLFREKAISLMEMGVPIHFHSRRGVKGFELNLDSSSLEVEWHYYAANSLNGSSLILSFKDRAGVWKDAEIKIDKTIAQNKYDFSRSLSGENVWSEESSEFKLKTSELTERWLQKIIEYNQDKLDSH